VRLSAGRFAQRQDGKYLGGDVPFGYALGEVGQLVESPEQIAVVDQIVTMRREGQSLRSIAGEMKRRSFQVSHVTVRRLLRDHAE
jgi:hypothetical protein